MNKSKSEHNLRHLHRHPLHLIHSLSMVCRRIPTFSPHIAENGFCGTDIGVEPATEATMASSQVFFHSIHEIDISKVTIGDPDHDGSGGRECQITYNGAPLKIRVPVGLVTGFQVQESLFHTDGSGHIEVIPGASLTCIIGFNGCDPYGKERCVAESSVGSIYNFVLSLQDRVVNYCVENGPRLFGKHKPESIIRETLHSMNVWYPIGQGRPSLRPKIAYSEMERHGDVRMAVTDDPASRPFPVISPSIGSKEFYMTPRLLILPQNGLRIAWRVGYVSDANR